MKSKVFSRTGRPLLFFCGILLVVPLAYADPVRMDDTALNSVTAGTGSHSHNEAGGSGGAIVGNSSVATISQTGGVSIDGESQANAKALNLVNSSESTVANGVNVWEGSNAASSAASRTA